MFQWFFDFFMAYLMPLVLQICDFLGIDMSSSKKVQFEDEKQKGGESDVPPASVASGFASDVSHE